MHHTLALACEDFFRCQEKALLEGASHSDELCVSDDGGNQWALCCEVGLMAEICEVAPIETASPFPGLHVYGQPLLFRSGAYISRVQDNVIRQEELLVAEQPSHI